MVNTYKSPSLTIPGGLNRLSRSWIAYSPFSKHGNVEPCPLYIIFTRMSILSYYFLAAMKPLNIIYIYIFTWKIIFGIHWTVCYRHPLIFQCTLIGVWKVHSVRMLAPSQVHWKKKIRSLCGVYNLLYATGCFHYVCLLSA